MLIDCSVSHLPLNHRGISFWLFGQYLTPYSLYLTFGLYCHNGLTLSVLTGTISQANPLLASLSLPGRPLQPQLDLKHFLPLRVNGSTPLSLFPNFNTVRFSKHRMQAQTSHPHIHLIYPHRQIQKYSQNENPRPRVSLKS